MVLFRSVLSAVAVLLVTLHQVADSAPVKKTFRKRDVLNPLAPLASDIDGAHLLLLNDVDSSTVKNAFVYLSMPRDYYSGMTACDSMGDGGYIYIPGTSGATDLVTLLNNNAPAQAEVEPYTQFWVYNGVPGVLSNCLAVNKDTGNTDWIPCSTQLPTVCFNSVMRRVLLFDDTSRQVIVNSPVGQIQGWRDQNAFRFLGIPYAEAPVGDLRFAAPVAKAPFTGIWNAIDYKGICPQTSQSAGFIALLETYLENGAAQMEDCLNLNVYTPSLKGTGAPLLPVMFYIHGGGFTTYSGSVILFEPGNLVSRGGVVVVTINYRLGMLGWMENDPTWDRDTVPGNQALRDQILALQWVQSNIAAFGGDPTRVSVFGESAGATSIRALLSAPSAWGLYESVIGESDPINIPFKLPASATKIGNYFMTALGCATDDLACARNKTFQEVLTAQTTANADALADDKWTTWALVERPTIDGLLIMDDFSELVKANTYNTKANIMWGTVHDEAGLFVPEYFPNPVPVSNVSESLELFFTVNQTTEILASQYFQLNMSDSDAVRDLFTLAGTEYYFFCPLRYLSRAMAQTKQTYNFRFDRGRDTPLVGSNYCSSSTGRVCHSADIQPVFGSGDAVPGYSQTGDDAQFSRQVIDRWTTFAKTANPNPKPGQQGVELTNPDVTSVNWLPYDDTNPILELNVQSAMSTNLENAPCTWLDTVFLYEFWLQIPGNTP
ncbi:hypothetical protein EMPS_10138 [Entomortierella parvispora]|uniref:Carboxylesterase type B domain-containing protein n=1 Tax=Entomortierella parvispora TaxID=205924 RepID=A0A9P3HJA2_9FUNG|nr:hypothetical protein EMPS_10138 [Entomortierella parvispora]